MYRDNDPLQPIIITCVGGSTVFANGTVPQSTWLEFTDFVGGIEGVDGRNESGISFEFSENGDGESSNNEYGSNVSKGISSEISIFGRAYDFVNQWLFSDRCAVNNSVLVRIEDTYCGVFFEEYEIKADNLRVCDSDGCVFTTKLRLADPVWNCFFRSTVYDNWNGMFSDTTTHPHPLFYVCLEDRPNTAMVTQLVLFHFVGIISLATINLWGQNWLRKIFNVGRKLPAPLVRDIISNVCQKCGISIDPTKSIFHDPNSKYYNLCYFAPIGEVDANKDQIGLDEGDTSPRFFNKQYDDLEPIDKFLNRLKAVFNAKWYISINNEFVFMPKSWFDNRPPIIDFNSGLYEWQNFCREFSGEKKPAYASLQYTPDQKDVCSSDAAFRYDTYVSYNLDNSFNPILEGAKTVRFEFAPTAFLRDYTSRDYIQRAWGASLVIWGFFGAAFVIALAPVPILGIILAAGFAAYFGTTIFLDLERSATDDYAGSIRISSTNVSLGRLIIWDGVDADNAFPVRDFGRNDPILLGVPPPNLYYNPTSLPYDEFAVSVPGSYTGASGNTYLTNSGVYNYQMTVNEKYTGNLYDAFHDYENPNQYPPIEQTFSIETRYCCEILQVLGGVQPYGDANVGANIILPTIDGLELSGRITNVKVNTNIIRIEGYIL